MNLFPFSFQRLITACTLFATLGLGLAPSVYAQRVAYLDSEKILKQMPEYTAVQKELETVSGQWQSELDNQYAKIEKKYSDYRAREVLLSREDKEKLQAEIIEDEKKAKDFQKEHFGYNGKLFKAREEKMKPVNAKLFQTVEQVAKSDNFQLVFDRTGGNVLLIYGAPQYDITDKVLLKMGLEPTKPKDTDSGASTPPAKPAGR
jgi:outer membrane protein